MSRTQVRPIPALALLAASLLAGPASTPPDLDVGVPPGSPTEWGQRFPAITPRSRPVFPVTADRDPRADDPTRTVAGGATPRLEAQIADTFGIVRILTWDVAAHLRWVDVPGKSGSPVTGAAGSEAAMPEPGSALHWTTTAALLRLLLHPQLVSGKELIAHLVEIGEPTLGMVAAARAEPALDQVCRDIRSRIGEGRRAARPLPGANPRATMLSRFVHDELLAAFPYDPEGGFGRRMFLFAEEVEPLLVEYASHEDPLLRRNAVAALGRYSSATASRTLLRVATQPSDPVAQMRALAAMGSHRALRAPEILDQRLQLSKDPVEQVALVQAIGRLGLHGAVPTLLGIGSKRNVDPDLLMAVLSALTRIRHAVGSDEAERFADWLAPMARNDPVRFRVEQKEPAPAADRPDGPGLRGEVIAQLALLLQVRLRPGDRELVEQVVALVPDEPEEEPRAARMRGAFGNLSLAAVHPPAQLLFLETLRELGPTGFERLRIVARDHTVEPALRGRALSLLPATDRAPLLADVLASTTESTETKIYAAELLGRSGHHGFSGLARAFLEDCAKVGERPASPEQRYLWLTLLRALERSSELEVEDLLPLLARVAGASHAKADVTDTLRDLVERLVADTAAGLSKSALRRRIDEILAVVIESEVNPRITAATESEAREGIGKQLVALRGRHADRGYHRLVADAVLRYLLGFHVRQPDRNRAEFAPVVLLEEEILFALGRTGSPAAAAALAKLLQEHEDNPFRAQACLALGAAGHPSLARYLVPLLLDADGFVRFCAYESLRHLTGQDFWTDWIYGEPRERGAAAEQYLRWCLRNR